MSSKPLLVAVLVSACMTSVQPWAGAAPRGGAQQALLDNVPELKSVAVQLAGDCDRLVFVGDSITISIDKVGLAHPSARMQAYDTQSGSPLWQGEVPIGRPGMVLDNYVWLDEAIGTLFIGNGPLSAIDARTGRVLWTKDYDEVGLVWAIYIGRDRILVHGSKKLGAAIAIKAGAEGAEAALEPMRRHMRNPRLICANRTTGATLWEYTFTAPKERGSTTHVPVGIDGYYILDASVTVVHGKQVLGVRNADGTEAWKFSKDIEPELGVSTQTVYVNVGGKITALSRETGQKSWEARGKADNEAAIVLGGDVLAAVNTGKYDSGKDRFEGKYKIVCFDAANGREMKTVVQGEDLGDYPVIGNAKLFVYDRKHVRVIDLKQDKELANLDRDKDVEGLTLVGDRYMRMGVKEVSGLGTGGSVPEWTVTLERSSRGRRPLFLRMVVGALNVGYAYYGSFSVGRGSTPRPDGITMTSDERLAEPLFLGDVLTWPTRKDGVVGISIVDGRILWRLTTGENPWPYYSSSGNVAAIQDGKTLRLVNLSPSTP